MERNSGTDKRATLIREESKVVGRKNKQEPPTSDLKIRSGIGSLKERKLDFGAILAGQLMQEYELASSFHPALMRMEAGEKGSCTSYCSWILHAEL